MNKKDKPQLGDWFKRQGALAAIRHIEAIPSLLKTSTEDAVVKMLASAADKARDDAGNIGTLTHQAIEHRVRKESAEGCTRHDEPPCVWPLPDDVAKGLEGFVKWGTDRKPKIIASEFMVVSETERYGATGDLAMTIDGDIWLVDVKTSSGVYAETGLQLAAIRWADHAGVPDDPKPYRVPQATHYGVLHVRPDGTEMVRFDVTDAEFRAFLACRDLYEWDRDRSRRVKAA